MFGERAVFCNINEVVRVQPEGRISPHAERNKGFAEEMGSPPQRLNVGITAFARDC
jgi:hypothetical protein